MAESFGTRLRQQRERQHVALTAIVAQTKIKLSLLEGLERDDVSHWPVGIFRRAYIRAYAQAIRLDPDAVVREFLDIYPDPMEPIEPGAIVAARGDADWATSAPPTRFRNLVDSALGSLTLLRSRNAPPSEVTRAVVPAADGSPPKAPPRPEPDLAAAARWCTTLARVEEAYEAGPLLREAARILDATGIIVWIWNAAAGELRHGLAYGYADSLLAQIPGVGRHADNATAAAFRTAETCTVRGTDGRPGALVAPMMGRAGCVGVLAIELQEGREQSDATQALATIFAAQLARVPLALESPQAITRRLA